MMQTFTIISAIIISAIAILLFALSKYRTYSFNKLSVDELKEKARSSRKVLYHICLDENKINSKHANLLRKSIAFLENRIQQLGGWNA